MSTLNEQQECPAPAEVAWTDEQIDALMPEPDGCAQDNIVRVEVLPGLMGTEFEEVGAWSRPLVRQAVRAALAVSQAQPKHTDEPLFLLHCGQIDSGGEQGDWDIEADSGKRVDEFCRLHPGQTINLHPHVQSPAPAPDIDVTKILLDVVPGEDGMGHEVYAKSVTEVVNLLTRMGERIEELEGRTQSIVPAGYKLVPVEPTYEMLVAGAESRTSRDLDEDDTLAPEYRAMLAASPCVQAPAVAHQAPEGWMLVPKVGTRVKADHPITCLNPEETFEVTGISVENGHISIRGDDTCWFGLGMISKPPVQHTGGEA